MLWLEACKCLFYSRFFEWDTCSLVVHFLANNLQVNKSLLWLGLGSNQVGAEGVWALVESLRTNSSLLWLGLGGNELGDRGALHLATLLQGIDTAWGALRLKTTHFATLRLNCASPHCELRKIICVL